MCPCPQEAHGLPGQDRDQTSERNKPNLDRTDSTSVLLSYERKAPGAVIKNNLRCAAVSLKMIFKLEGREEQVVQGGVSQEQETASTKN